MKIYLLTYCENSDYSVAADADVFLTKQAAHDTMEKQFNRLCDVTGQNYPTFVEDDDHCHNIDEWGAGINNGYDSYNWTITEKELPVKVAVVLYGGLAEGIYTTAESLDAEVIDLDLDENKEGQKAVDAIEKDPGMKKPRPDYSGRGIFRPDAKPCAAFVYGQSPYMSS